LPLYSHRLWYSDIERWRSLHECRVRINTRQRNIFCRKEGRMKHTIRSLFLFFVGMGVISCSPQREREKAVMLPNIIYIIADDLGYGDLSCYGQKRFQTPNIDRLAAEGMRFTQHCAGTAVCAPSRSVLMTGLHTGHTPIRGNKEWQPEGQWPLPDSAYTLAEMLKEVGYVTGAFGKWGLGFVDTEGAPHRQGFDRFYG